METYECLPSQYCSYASDSDVKLEKPLRKCLPKYSQDVGTEFGWEILPGSDYLNPSFEDYKYNGQYCMSGLAFPKSQTIAKCTKVHQVEFDGEVLWSEKDWDPKVDAPPTFECDPTDNSKMCELKYYITDPDVREEFAIEKSFFTTCKCSMDGTTGYCGQVLGTQVYADGLYNIKNVMESSDCHTLDRHDWRAQKEDCNVSTAEDWDRAVSDLFNLNHWPYVNGKDENIRNCIKTTFKDSP